MPELAPLFLRLPTSGTSSSLIHPLFRGRRGPSLPRRPLNHYLGLSTPHPLPHQPTARQWEHWAPQAWPSPEPKAAAAAAEVWVCERRHRGGSQGWGCGKRRLLLALQVLGSQLSKWPLRDSALSHCCACPLEAGDTPSPVFQEVEIGN